MKFVDLFNRDYVQQQTCKQFAIYLLALSLPIITQLVYNNLPHSFHERPVINIFLLPVIF